VYANARSNAVTVQRNGNEGIGTVPVLLEAIKEQHMQSEKQQLKIEMQQNELDELKKVVQQLINTKQ
jgi:hypothetical protein